MPVVNTASPNAAPRRADGAATEDGAVLEQQVAAGVSHSANTTLPSATVLHDRARVRVSPRSHEFAERERKPSARHGPLRLEVEEHEVRRLAHGDASARAARTRVAGPADIRSSTSSSGSTPGSTSVVLIAAKAVSSPVTPNGASSNGASFSCRACGAWSVAMQAIVPSTQRPRRAPAGRPRCASGGFIFALASSERTSSSVRAEVVRADLAGRAARPAARARRSASTDSRAERCMQVDRPVLVARRARGRARPSSPRRPTASRRSRARPRRRPRASGRRARASAPRSGARAGRSATALYCSARRISPAERTGLPSSVNATAPAAASSAISVSSSPREALRDRRHEAGRDDASSRARSTSELRTDADVDDRVGVRHRQDRAVAAGGGRRGAGRDRLLVLAARGAQVDVRVDERRREDEAGLAVAAGLARPR